MSSEIAPTSAQGVRDCPIADALDLIGDRWSLLIIREINYGETRFSMFQERTGAPRQILTARLRKLEAGGVIMRRQYSERPPRFEYLLTEAGEKLTPVLRALRAWGEQYAQHEVDGQSADLEG